MTSGSIQLILPFIKCFLSNPAITDQSRGINTGLFQVQPHLPLSTLTFHIFSPFIPISPALNSITTNILFSPQRIVIIYLCPFIQISLKYNSNLFSSPQSPPRLETSPSLLSFHPPLLLGVSSVTRVQWVCNPGSNPPSQLRHPLYDLNFAVSHFFFPVSIPVASVNTTQLFVWLYLGPSNSLNAFLKDPLNFTPGLSELPASFLALSTLPAIQQISECCY